MELHAIILAGGSGTRFWPLSRESLPKQMLNIVGNDTLLQHTIKRITEVVKPENIWIVTTQDKAEAIRFHIESLGNIAKEIKLILEPFGKNTAAAIGLTAIHIKLFFPNESIMIVMPSDHLIPDKKNFLNDLNRAIEVAKKGYLITFGIKPSRPETGYGYIKTKDTSNEDIHVLKVERFVEKPDLKTAETFLYEGNYFWNLGIFVWKTSKILSDIEIHLPNLHRTLKEIETLLPSYPDIFSLKGLKRSENKDSIYLKGLYERLESISIDYGIMEKSKDVFMVPATFKWSDLGSFTALDEVIEKDSNGNILKGNFIDIGSSNTIILSGKRLIATIGLNNMVVVDTPDATLIVPKSKTQEVRRIVEILKREGRKEYLVHKTVEKPWGKYTVLEKGDGYKIKKIVINPGARLSLQVHKKRGKQWVVLSGVAKVTRDNEIFFLQSEQNIFIPQNSYHRVENTGPLPLQIIEVQYGEYLEEDDIERLEDDYGR